MYTMRFDLRVPGMKPDEVADQYEAALQMAEFGESNGCVAMMLSEHHRSPDGYLPTPLVMAAAVAARTTTLPIVIGAALLPLYEPRRLVEEMIVLDNLSRGRVSFIFGIGYRPTEYDLFDLPYEDRGKLADEKLADRHRRAGQGVQHIVGERRCVADHARARTRRADPRSRGAEDRGSRHGGPAATVSTSSDRAGPRAWKTRTRPRRVRPGTSRARAWSRSPRSRSRCS